MTTPQVEVAIMRYFDYRKCLIVPNITTISNLVGFETDMLVLTKSGFATGVEIKVSKSDLKADLKKEHWKFFDKISFQGKSGKEIYFGRLKYFYYAVPVELKDAALEQIPEWCGLLTVREYNNRLTTITERKAKFIHNYKWSLLDQYKVARLGTIRIYNYKLKEIT